MKKVGIICEFNPLHKGHIHFINEVKKLYPDSLLILILGSYFLQRGDVSLISKWNKTTLALDFGIDLILELPTLYNINSADFFAYYSVKILNDAGINTLVFGSESNDLESLESISLKQEEIQFQSSVKNNLDKGLNYPTSLTKSLNTTLESNDILGISYIKAIKKINPSIEVNLVKRTNSFNDVTSNDEIISASNIREKIKNNLPIDNFIPVYNKEFINKVDFDKLFLLLKYKIITDNHLERYLGVDEGLENKLKKEILASRDFDNLIDLVKSKRYTISRLKRMLMHILLGIEKTDMEITHTSSKVLGFNLKGQKYLSELKSSNLVYKYDSRINEIEKCASVIYYELTKDESVKYEFLNKPIIKRD